jgi:hypothetical protein
MGVSHLAFRVGRAGYARWPWSADRGSATRPIQAAISGNLQNHGLHFLKWRARVEGKIYVLRLAIGDLMVRELDMGFLLCCLAVVP